MDNRTKNIMNLMNELGADFDIPREFENETPTEELLHDWEGGVLNEVE